MNKVVYLKRLSARSTPCLVLVDLQREYVSETALRTMSDPIRAVNNCRSALHHAREVGLSVAFVRRKDRPRRGKNAPEFLWIEGFEPSRRDMVFDRDKPSCYASKLFAELMDSCSGHFVLAGFAGETSCISTVVDAFHKNHRVVFLSDASASRVPSSISARSFHDAVSGIIGSYGEVMETKAWIDAQPKQVVVLEG